MIVLVLCALFPVPARDVVQDSAATLRSCRKSRAPPPRQSIPLRTQSKLINIHRLTDLDLLVGLNLSLVLLGPKLNLGFNWSARRYLSFGTFKVQSDFTINDQSYFLSSQKFKVGNATIDQTIICNLGMSWGMIGYHTFTSRRSWRWDMRCRTVYVRRLSPNPNSSFPHIIISNRQTPYIHIIKLIDGSAILSLHMKLFKL